MAFILLILSALLATAVCHEPLTNGTSKGPLYSTWLSPLTIPSVKFSLSAKRYSTAEGQVFWFAYNATAGDLVQIGAGSGAAVANAKLRINAYVFGPGLSKKYKQSDFRVPVPTGPGFRYKYYKGGSNLSNCKWLKTPGAKEGNTVVTYNGVTRCGSLNNITGLGFFPALDDIFKAPKTATYYLAFYLDKTYKAAWYVNPGNPEHSHDEDHELPKPPPGNAPEIDTAALTNTVTSSLYGVDPYSFSLRK